MFFCNTFIRGLKHPGYTTMSLRDGKSVAGAWSPSAALEGSATFAPATSGIDAGNMLKHELRRDQCSAQASVGVHTSVCFHGPAQAVRSHFHIFRLRSTIQSLKYQIACYFVVTMNIDFNIYATIILLALSIDYILNLLGDYLNLKALRPELPDEFKDVYDEEKYRESQRYERVNTRFSLVVSTFNLIVLLIFWFAGGFFHLDRIIRSRLPSDWSENTVVAGLCFAGSLLILKFLINLPFRIYGTFVIEARFGFNRTTPGVFIGDTLKITLLSTLLGAPLFAALIAFFEYAGDLAWLYCWIATTVFVLVLQFIAPRWIMPLFNKFTPLEQGELRQAVEDYAAQVDFPLAGLYVIDGSRRSTKSNAFFTGFGKHKRIALFDTLINQHTIPELLTVLAHEIGHYKKKHILKGMVLNILHMGFLFFLLSIFLDSASLFKAFGFEPPHMPIYAGFVFFGMLYAPIELVLSIFLNAHMRKNEREADHFAVETTGRREAFAKALKKLSRDNLANLTPHPLCVKLHYSHPPVLERIRNINKQA